ncbi:MAG: stage II sporulation protein M [Oscillospiraceae bacterium]|nr:stage II sporulation protein M [Oscillospiraceae bacterium]
MKVIDKKSKYRSIHVSGDLFFTLLTMIVLVGAIIGSLYYREISAMDFVKTFSIADSFYNFGETISFWNCFSYSLMKNTILIVIIFLSGLCLVGHSLCIVTLLYKGINAGVSLSIAYSNSSIENFIIPILHIILDTVVSTFVLVLATKEGIRFSNKLFRLVIYNKIDDDLNKNIRLYLLKFAILFVIIVLLSLVQSIFLIFIG